MIPVLVTFFGEKESDESVMKWNQAPSDEEQQRWKLFCQQRLENPQFGAPNTLEAFNQARQELAVSATPFQQQVLEQWQEYADSLAARVNA